jgi:ATP-binding cassette subfamily F protein uup
MNVEEAERSGRVVIKARDVRFAYAETPIVDGFSTTVLRGDRVGIVGPNGAGKTTLLRLLLGELTPAAGSVHHGTRLEIAYYDQLRGQLRDGATVAENVADGRETLVTGGRRRHVTGYLQDFLFTPDRARTLVRALSGGERNRLLLARLFTRPSNVIVMDEPTNDLDLETLELLEEQLLGYTGTVLLVSHDRTFLDNVVTSLLICEEGGRIREFVGGYDDWRRRRDADRTAPPRARRKPPASEDRAARDRPRKLSYKEHRELEALPDRIEALEAEKQELFDRLGDPAFYKADGAEIAAARARLDEIEAELAAGYERWQALEELRARRRR